MSPSKHKTGAWVLNPFWQIAGVFFTAFVLAFLNYYFAKKFLDASGDISLYPQLLFLSVVIFYTLDHLFDELKFRRTDTNKRRSLLFNGTVLAVAFVLLVTKIVTNFNDISFSALWFPAGLTALYFLLVLVFKVAWRGFKEILIALVVSCALFYHSAAESGWVANFAIIFPVFLVCVQNLVVFGFFEKEKDEFYGFSTAFTGLHNINSIKIPAFILLVITAVGVGYFIFFDNRIPQIFMCSGAFLFMLMGHRLFSKYRLYRFVADAVLLLLVV